MSDRRTDRFILSPCLFCDARCCRSLAIAITSFDALRISNHTGLDSSEFCEFISPRLINLNCDHVLDFYKDGVFSSYGLLCIKSGPCFFLKGNRCTIHSVAPMGCKKYPLSSFGGTFSGAVCPSPHRKLFSLFGKIPDNYEKEMSAYSSIVSKWNDVKGEKKDCLDFLISEAKKFSFNF